MTEPVVVITRARLTQAAYGALEKQALTMLNKLPSTGEQALVACGVEHVLRLLRIGYVIEGSE